jgi:hypothetical protein
MNHGPIVMRKRKNCCSPNVSLRFQTWWEAERIKHYIYEYEEGIEVETYEYRGDPRFNRVQSGADIFREDRTPW